MPCFNQFKREGDLVGRLLAGYGELELELAQCVMATNKYNTDATIRTLFKVRGEKKRIDTADSMMRQKYVQAGLRVPYERAIKDMHFCRLLRNQYAHCNWYCTVQEGLHFIDLEGLANSSRRIIAVTKRRRGLDVPLLERQEAYFKYVQKCFWYLAEAFHRTQQVMKTPPLWTRPKRIARPRRHT
jgi:hypothetical protein